jgi:hypothetical protein
MSLVGVRWCPPKFCENHPAFLLHFAGVVFAVTGLFAADTKSAGTPVTSPLVSVPATSQTPGPMANGVLFWESILSPITTNISAADRGRNLGIANAGRPAVNHVAIFAVVEGFNPRPQFAA